MSNVQAAVLIIKHIQMLEQAKELMDGEVGEKFLTSVDQKVKKYIDSIGWVGIYNFCETNDLWFLPDTWKEKTLDINDSKKTEGLYAKYELWVRHDGELANEWWLSSFLPNNRETMVFNFWIDFDKFKVKPNKKERKLFTLNYHLNDVNIEKSGFKYNQDEGFWYLPISGLDPEEVIKNYESDTLEDSLTPITDALAKLKYAHQYFDKIVQAAIAKFGRIENEE
ncbi:hypothetical protein [Acinetobacter haemolyticus]|uniref:hypothetical protein n=1 Tax=Acinetobacter haemolyticus TaxID=29430 RepID=UPI000E1691F0|nr:hypothetical protein [Acinetobacter haemolyticus]SUU23947.1 Uncharacterised protein [Acinetobacter haemolyticus]